MRIVGKNDGLLSSKLHPSTIGYDCTAMFFGGDEALGSFGDILFSSRWGLKSSRDKCKGVYRSGEGGRRAYLVTPDLSYV